MSARHRRWTLGACFFVLVSGILWLVAHYLLAGDCDFGVCRGPLEPWLLRLHGAAAMFALVQFGTLLPVHVKPGWRSGANRVAGAMVVGGVAILLGTAYLLYYVGDESWHAGLGVLHWCAGFAVIPVLAAHLALGRAGGTVVPKREG